LLKARTELNRKHYQAWQVINSAQGKGGSGGRIDALEELNRDAVPLVGADLSDAFLQVVDLKGSNLLRANLRSCDIRDSSFVESRLEYADLTSANLRHSDLQKANLQNANLPDAEVHRSFADLSFLNCFDRRAGIWLARDFSIKL
jgi:uncharacterized protein YjbI with pentapeptide repeats